MAGANRDSSGVATPWTSISMWTPTTRAQHSRAGLRYGSDVTDAEWAILEPMLPAEAECGRKREWSMREIVNAIFYVLRGGIGWRLLPDSFPPGRRCMAGLLGSATTGHGSLSTIVW